MKKKPTGLRYRNLTRRGRVIYYERVASGRRISLSAATGDWDEAAAFRDLYEETTGIGKFSFAPPPVPTFADFADRYLREDTANLALSTRAERERELRADGPILGYFGEYSLDQIGESQLREWWTLKVEGASRKTKEGERKPLSTKTGKNRLDVIAAVLGYALELGLIESSPVDGFRRKVLSRKARTQKGRAEADPARFKRPIEDPDDLSRILTEAREEGLPAYVFVLLCLDAGLRTSEARALRWGSIRWGESEDDPRRSLDISEAWTRAGLSLTKSGRIRRVHLSRRLRRALENLNRVSFGPRLEEFVFGLEFNMDLFRRYDWRRVLRRAKIDVDLKDLRDSYASHLLTSGVPIGYVSKQLGHASVGTTLTHYAKWIEDEEYRPPLPLNLGEVPADLLARLPERSPIRSPITSDDERAKSWWSQRESNPCLQGENLVS